MGKNRVREVIRGNVTWTCPAGVRTARVIVAMKIDQQAAHGTDSVAVIAADGQLYSQGINDLGQLGLGDVLPRSSPVLVLGNKIWRTVSALGSSNSRHFLMMDVLGDAYGMGANVDGRLGVNTATVAYSSPVLVVGGHKWRKIVASVQNGAGITVNGALYAWGNNAVGQLGDGTVISKSSPNFVPGSTQWRDVAFGSSHMLALRFDGSLYSWGLNNFGQLGDGGVTPRSSPVLVAFGPKFKQIEAGGSTSGGVTEDGDAYLWGAGTLGQIGNGSILSRSTPTLVSGGHKFRSIHGGAAHFFGIKNNGDLMAWGLNTSGQLGVGDIVSRSTPTLVVGGDKFSTVAGGNTDTVGILAFGQQRGWGSNTSGGIGDGTVVGKSSPAITATPASLYRTIINGVVADVVVEVVPGESYDVTVFDQIARFGAYGIYTDPSLNGILPIEMYIEYEG